MPEDPWTDEDDLLMHLINEHGLGQWQVHGDPTLMHNAAHMFPEACDHTHEVSS